MGKNLLFRFSSYIIESTSLGPGLHHSKHGSHWDSFPGPQWWEMESRGQKLHFLLANAEGLYLGPCE